MDSTIISATIHYLLPSPLKDKILMLIADLLTYRLWMSHVLLARKLKRGTSYTFISGEFLGLLKICEERGFRKDPKNLRRRAHVLQMLLWRNESCLC